MSEFTHKYHTGGPVTSAAAVKVTVGEALIQRVSEHCAQTPVAKHKPESCDETAEQRAYYRDWQCDWQCECECHV